MASSSSSLQSAKVLVYADVNRGWFTNQEKYDDYAAKYACCVCTTLYPTVHTTLCGHAVCSACSQTLPSDACPHCTLPLGNPRVIEFKIASRDVASSLQLKCVWSECTSVCTFSDFLVHVNQQCRHRRRECMDCGVTITQGEYNDHEGKECKAKWVTDCKACQSNHRVDECPTSVIPCPYFRYGCVETGPRADILNKHALENYKKHLQCVDSFVKALHQQLFDKSDVGKANKDDNNNNNKERDIHSSKRKRMDTVSSVSSSSSSSSLVSSKLLEKTRPTEIEERWACIDSILAIKKQSDRPFVMVSDPQHHWYIAQLQSRVQSGSCDRVAIHYVGFLSKFDESIPTMSGRIRPLFPTYAAQVEFYAGLQRGDHIDIHLEQKQPDGQGSTWHWAQGIIILLHPGVSISIKIIDKPNDVKDSASVVEIYYTKLSYCCAPYGSFYKREDYSSHIYPPRVLELPLSSSSSSSSSSSLALPSSGFLHK